MPAWAWVLVAISGTVLVVGGLFFFGFIEAIKSYLANWGDSNQ